MAKVLGMDSQISAAIFAAGFGTIIYQLLTKFRSPIFLGLSFAFLIPLLDAQEYGFCGVVVGSFFASLVNVIIAIIVHFVGIKRINKYFPPVIIGPVVSLIGLQLAGSAMSDFVKADKDAKNGSYNLVAFLIGAITFIITIICSMQKKYQLVQMMPFIIGIGTGYVLAGIFSIFGYTLDVEYLKITDFTPLKDNFKPVKFKSFLYYP